MKNLLAILIGAAFLFSAPVAAKNIIKNPGFEEINKDWYSEDINGAISTVNDSTEKYSGHYSGTTNAIADSFDYSSARLSQELFPTKVSDLNQEKNLQWWYKVISVFDAFNSEAFYITLSSSEGRHIHYSYLDYNNKSFLPSSTQQEKYIVFLTTKFEPTDWKVEVRDFYEDWVEYPPEFPPSDHICKIMLTDYASFDLLDESSLKIAWDDIVLGDGTGIEEKISENNKIQIHNLFDKVVIKNFGSESKNINIYDTSGRVVKKYCLQSNEEIYFRDKAGIYFLKTKDEVKKIILIK
jgi:hypothetical protein